MENLSFIGLACCHLL